MRIMGFSQKWPKLRQFAFTTYRVERRDKDWQVGEVVQIVYKPRSKDRQILGTAVITSKVLRRLQPLGTYRGEPSSVPFITLHDAITDGFPTYADMDAFFRKAHGLRGTAFINRYVLCWRGSY